MKELKEPILPTTLLWKPSLWEKIALWFVPMEVYVDATDEPWKSLPMKIFVKRWRGRIYVMKEKVLDIN